MKKPVLLFTLLSLLSTQAIAKDVAQGRCEITLKKNKTKIKALKRSVVEFNDMEIKPLTRFDLSQNIYRIYINPEEKTKIHKNVISLLEGDQGRLEVLDYDNDIDYVKVDGGRKVYVKVSYIGKNVMMGGQFGPALFIQSVAQDGSFQDKYIKLNTKDETSVKYRIYTTVNQTQLNEEGAAIANIRKKRQFFIECSFKSVEISDETASSAAQSTNASATLE